MKGFLIGNPYINEDAINKKNKYSFLTTLYYHSLLPPNEYLNVSKKCGYD